MLDAVRASASRDAAWLNLVGVVHEWRGEWKMARRCYGRAIGADGQYEPAQQNMRRLYELRSLGHCVKPVALGDEVPALIALLRTTEAENATRRGGGAEEERSNSIAQRRGETETQRR